MPQQQICPCGSGQNFNLCCEPCLSGISPARTAEALMRSRYTAYVTKDECYLLSSWHESTRPAVLGIEQDTVKWLGLKLVATQAGREGDETGSVEFVARYKLNGKAHRLHERSRFVKQQGCWFYVGAEKLPAASPPG